jgi:hypothetical protein
MNAHTGVHRNQYMEQLAKELHRPIVRKFPRRHVHSNGIDDLWGGDLADMTEDAMDNNNGYRYILIVIDHASKYIWGLPLRTKTGTEVAAAFTKIFRKGRHPKHLWVDRGAEFFNSNVAKVLKTYNVDMYSTHSEIKVSIAERAIQTMKHVMHKLFTQHRYKKWITTLPHVVEEYNNRRHSVIRVTPNEFVAGKQLEQAIDDLALPNRGAVEPINELPEPKLNIGDIVRISKYKRTFEKGFTANWSSEQFEIEGFRQTPGDPIVYYLRDLRGEKIEGSFYAQELQIVKYPYPIQFVDKVIERRGKNAFVSFVGFDERFNRVIPEKDIK